MLIENGFFSDCVLCVYVFVFAFHNKVASVFVICYRVCHILDINVK